MTMVKNFDKYLKIIKSASYSNFHGFISKHDYLSKRKISTLNQILNNPDDSILLDFESKFSSIIGNGKTVSFASGRMGFYALLKIIGIRPGDEVVLQAATCSVMANAIIRVGAKPIFADISSRTFGSDLQQIQKVITEKTKMIVAQHSFGIPCDILPIVEFANKKSIFLLEDCALSVGSKINNITVGNFGNASLFSTDRSKPINSIIGGLIYSNDSSLISSLKETQNSIPELERKKQKALFDYLKFEKKYLRDNIIKFQILLKIRLSFLKRYDPFLSEDFSSIPSHTYPYPSKLPVFLAQLGLYELERWKENKKIRKSFLANFIKLAKQNKFINLLPDSYFDNSLDIIPHRIVWTQDNGEAVRNKLSALFDVSWIWFLKPLAATNEPLYLFGYKDKSCPIAESSCEGMVNIPNPINKNYHSFLESVFKILG